MTRHLTKEEFAEVFDIALTELSGHGLIQGEEAVKESLPLRTEVEEALKLLRDPRISRERAVGVAIGLVDEFVRARWDQLIEELYAAYTARAGTE